MNLTGIEFDTYGVIVKFGTEEEEAREFHKLLSQNSSFGDVIVSNLGDDLDPFWAVQQFVRVLPQASNIRKSGTIPAVLPSDLK